MSTSLNNKLKQLGGKRQAKIQKRASDLVAEEMTLKELRSALELTQRTVIEKLHIRWDIGHSLTSSEKINYNSAS